MINGIESIQKSPTISQDLTVAVYIRVSTEKQDGNTSKETQLQSIKSYIKSIWPDKNVNSIFYNETMSASLTPKNLKNLEDYSLDVNNFYEMIHRPELKRLILDGRLKKFSDVLVYSHDRLGRNEYELFMIRTSFKAYKLKLHYCKLGESQNSDNGEMNNLMDNLLNWFAVNESLTIARRVRDGVEKVAKSGKWAGGKPPFGYRLIKKSNIKKSSFLAKNNLEAQVVERIFDLYILGYSPSEIAKKIKKEYEYFSNMKWNKDIILDILKNPTYTGYLTWNKRGGKKNPKRHVEEAFISSSFNESICIIEMEKWEKAKILRVSKQKASKTCSTPFLLKGIINCYHCGEPLKCKNHGNITGRVYMCSTLDCKKIRSIKAEELHNIVIKNIQLEFEKLLSEKNKIDKFLESYIESVDYINKKKDLEIRDLKLKINENNKIIEESKDTEKRLEIALISIAPIDYEGIDSKYLLESVKEINILKVRENIKIQKNVEVIEESKFNYITNKEQLKESIDIAKTSLENILKESLKDEKIKRLRLFLLEIFKIILISDDNTLKLIFK